MPGRRAAAAGAASEATALLAVVADTDGDAAGRTSATPAASTGTFASSQSSLRRTAARTKAEDDRLVLRDFPHLSLLLRVTGMWHPQSAPAWIRRVHPVVVVLIVVGRHVFYATMAALGKLAHWPSGTMVFGQLSYAVFDLACILFLYQMMRGAEVPQLLRALAQSGRVHPEAALHNFLPVHGGLDGMRRASMSGASTGGHEHDSHADALGERASSTDAQKPAAAADAQTQARDLRVARLRQHHRRRVDRQRRAGSPAESAADDESSDGRGAMQGGDASDASPALRPRGADDGSAAAGPGTMPGGGAARAGDDDRWPLAPSSARVDTTAALDPLVSKVESRHTIAFVAVLTLALAMTWWTFLNEFSPRWLGLIGGAAATVSVTLEIGAVAIHSLVCHLAALHVRQLGLDVLRMDVSPTQAAARHRAMRQDIRSVSHHTAAFLVPTCLTTLLLIVAFLLAMLEVAGKEPREFWTLLCYYVLYNGILLTVIWAPARVTRVGLQVSKAAAEVMLDLMAVDVDGSDDGASRRGADGGGRGGEAAAGGTATPTAEDLRGWSVARASRLLHCLTAAPVAWTCWGLHMDVRLLIEVCVVLFGMGAAVTRTATGVPLNIGG